jgi:protein TonB
MCTKTASRPMNRSFDRPLASPRARARVIPVLALAIVLALAGCGKSEPEAPAATAAAPAAAAPEAAPSEPPLTLANRAFREGRVVAPPGDNALEHALHALQQDANNAGATEILVDITPIAASAIEADIAARNFAEAERVMALLASANPSSLTVQALQRRLAAANRVVAAETEAANAATAAANERAAQASAAATAAAETVPPAAAPATAAAPAPPPRPAATAATTPPPAETREEEAPAAAAVAAPPRAPATTSASRTTDPVPTVKIAPAYPPQAKKRRAEGWVELQFMVGADGVPRQIEVVRAQPAGMFDRAAIQALSRWKFKPAERDGVAVEARAKTTIAFKP